MITISPELVQSRGKTRATSLQAASGVQLTWQAICEDEWRHADMTAKKIAIVKPWRKARMLRMNPETERLVLMNEQVAREGSPLIRCPHCGKSLSKED